MKRSWTALAVSFFALGMLAGCNDYNNSVQYNTGATITNISPSGLPAGTPTGVTLPNCPNTPAGQTNPCFTLYVIASALNPFSSTATPPLVQWNGQKLTTTFIDSTNISAQVPYSLIAKPGNAAVNVYQPQNQGTGYNGLSNALTFIIYGAPNPSPSLSSLTPNSTAVCTSKCANVAITLSGSNFLPTTQNGGSSVTYTGLATNGIETAISVTSITSSEIKASIPGGYLASADSNAKINVINPPSAICLVNCPDLGGGDTNCTTPPVVSGCVPSTQVFSVGSAAAAAASAALTVTEETPALSQDGRYVAFASMQDDKSQILIRDTCLGAAKDCTPTTQVVSAAVDGSAGNGDSHNAVMTIDGRYVAFSSVATNLVQNAPTGRQVYLRDTCIGTSGTCKPNTLLASTDEEGKLAGTEAILPSISSSGRFVAFLAVTPSPAAASGAKTSPSHARAAVGPNSGLRQVFVRDTCLGAANCTPKTTRISLQPGDAPADPSKPAGPALSGLAKQIAISGGKSSTVFTPTVPVDDRVFLAIPDTTQ
jgi:hypothetical protein